MVAMWADEHVYFSCCRLKHPLDRQAIGNILYGMQHMSSEHEAVRNFLAALLENLQLPRKNGATLCLKAEEVSSAFYGMQRMDVADREVRDVLTFLLGQLENCDEMVSGRSVSNIMLGLQNKTSDHEVVRNIVRAMSNRVGNLSKPLSLLQFGSAMYGLHCMSSDVEEVRDLLSALCDHLSPRCTGAGQTRSAVNALYGMQCMDSEHPEVRRVLSLLASRLKAAQGSTTESLTAQGFGMAMYGLQLMTCQPGHPETEAMLQVLLDRARADSVLLDVRAVSNSLYGLISSMKYPSDATARKLLGTIVSHLLTVAEGVVVRVRESAGGDSSSSDASVEEMQDLWRSLVLFSHFSGSSAALTPDLKTRLGQLCSDLSLHTPHSTLHVLRGAGEMRGDEEARVSGTDSIEQRVQKQVDFILQQKPTVQITYNEMLYGFECDIVLRVTSVDGLSQSLPLSRPQVPAIIRNFEVDGITHLQPRKRKFCNLRDLYLEDKHGISVSRLRLPDRTTLTDQDLHAAVSGHLNSLKLFATTQQTQHTFF